MRKGPLLLIFFLGYTSSRGQTTPLARNAFMSGDVTQAFEFWNIKNPSVEFHSSFKPFLSSTWSGTADSLVPFRFYGFTNNYLSRNYNTAAGRKLHYNLQILPVAELETGYDPLQNANVISALAGFHGKININEHFTAAFTAVGGRRSYPFFLDTTLSAHRIIPEHGQAYREPGQRSYAFSDFTGYLSFSPKKSRVFNFQAGRDKHFIGEGYRSLLLSDFGPAYPFFRINTNIWRLQYHAWYTWMYDVGTAGGIKRNFNNKYGTFHYLSYNIIKEVNVSLFENIVWRGSDSLQNRTFEVNYLNPVILLRPQEYSVGSPDNSFIGLNVSAILFRKIKFYAQAGLDEFFLKEIRARRGWWANKQGWQLGLKAVNAFGIKGLKLQAEYNEVRPYTYTHGLVDQNYGHYGVPLAHPAGANFREFIGIISHRKKRSEISVQGMALIIGKDSTHRPTNVGQNIFESYVTRHAEYGHYTTQGVKTTVLHSHIKYTWYLVPEMLLRVEAGYIQRSEKNGLGYRLENPYFYISIRSTIWNSYRDF